MARKKTRKSRPSRSDIASYLDAATQVAEPALIDRDRRRIDELGVIGAQELGDKGFFAGVSRATPSVPPKTVERTTVLVVEDDPGTSELIRRVLAAAGYKTRQASDRAQLAEELCRTPLPDLILLDVMLPEGLSGFDMLNRMRQHRVLTKVPVVMLTSLADRAHVIKGLGLGADGYLTKPVRPSVLITAVRTLLGG